MENISEPVPKAAQTPNASAVEKNRKPSGDFRIRILPPEAEAAKRCIEIADLRARRPWVPILCGLLVHVVCLLVLSAVAEAVSTSGYKAAVLALGGAIILAPLFRGLENLVHGAAHWDVIGRTGTLWQVRRTRLNDAIANALFAIPVGQDVVAFRAVHLPEHHGRFNQDGDPCRRRMRAHPDTMLGRLPTLASTLPDLPREIRAFYSTVGAGAQFMLRGLVWQLIFYVAPLSFVFGLSGLCAWISIVVPLFAVTLPAVRIVAEAGEHDYRPSAAELSIAERTFAHDGFFNRIIHLFGDDLHPEHHLWPDIPQYNLREVRRRALKAGLGRFLRTRKSVLGPATCYE